MVTLRRHILLNALRLFDLGVVLFAFTAATVVVYGWHSASLAAIFVARVKVANFIILCGFLWICHLDFAFFGFYRSRRFSNFGYEIVDIAKATCTAMPALVALTLLFQIRLFTPTYLAVVFVITTATITASRLLMRWCLRWIRAHGRNLRNLLIVGTNQRAVGLACKITAASDLGYRVVGFADDKWPGIETFGQAGLPLVSDLKSIRGFLRNNVVDEVIVCLPVVSFHQQCEEIRGICQEQGILVKSLAYNPDPVYARAEEFDGDLLIRHSGDVLDSWPAISKRLLDFSFALAGIIVFSPLLLFAALAIKLTSKGPVLFVQHRIGLNKRKFKIYKFRTMVPDAEHRISEIEHLNEVSGPVFKIEHDPRITRIGHILRKTSIDELPQLFNVLKGDMSLVGPRPLPLRDYDGFKEDWHRRRLSVLPGITCLWQIQGRSLVPFAEWMALDNRYVSEWSVWLDLKILFKTIPVVIRCFGAVPKKSSRSVDASAPADRSRRDM
jgi:exopolysaccharide biosynthesis polyprenyl glycosylphosphotransferase